MTFTPRAALRIAAAATAALAARAGAAPVPAVAPSIQAGDRVVLSWSTLPDRADEFEVLLSVDGSGRSAIRATASLDPWTRSISWRVPNLPARRARLRIRWGERGRETESPWSEPFEIRAAGSGRLEALHRDGREIALGASSEPPLDGPPAASSGPAMSAPLASAAAALRTVPALPPPSSRATPSPRRDDDFPESARSPRRDAPTSAPLRL